MLVMLSWFACTTAPSSSSPTSNTSSGSDTSVETGTPIDTATNTPTGTDTASSPTGTGDTGGTGGTGDTGDNGVSTLRLQISFTGWWSAYSTCTEVGIQEWFVSIDDGSMVQVQQVPCDLEVDIAVDFEGPVDVWVADRTPTPTYGGSPFAASAPAAATLELGEIVSVPLEVSCNENGVDDGCGGA